MYYLAFLQSLFAILFEIAPAYIEQRQEPFSLKCPIFKASFLIFPHSSWILNNWSMAIETKGQFREMGLWQGIIMLASSWEF
jgi:hypothetical protein